MSETPSPSVSRLSLSPIIMGTWQAGKQYWPGIDDGEILAAIHAALDAGINAFDTAEEYGDGLSERVLGQALRPHRNKVFILTKVFSNHLRHDQVVEACERSLKNLRTETIDLYQIHWPSGSFGTDPVPISETMEALRRLRDQGKIREIGVSNFTLEQLREADADGDIVSLQPPYSLFWRHIDREIRPYCEARGIKILAYSPLAQGILTGKIGADHRFAEGDHRTANKLFHPDTFPSVPAALDRLRPIAQRLDVSLAELALAWCAARPLTHPIAGARNGHQVRQNAAAASLELSPDDLAEIDAIGRTVSDRFVDDPVPWSWDV